MLAHYQWGSNWGPAAKQRSTEPEALINFRKGSCYYGVAMSLTLVRTYIEVALQR